MRVVIYSKLLKKKDIPYVQNLFDVLHEFGIAAYVYKPYLEAITGKIEFKSNIGTFEGYLDFKLLSYDFVITLGGDGTILGATTLIRDSNVPILGINLGRLGFLAGVSKGKIRTAIELMKKGQYSLEERTTIHLESNIPLFGDVKFALNDFTLLKRDTSSMITIHTLLMVLL
jgi:NAD+ kinase